MIDTSVIRQSIIDNAIEGKLINKESCSILSGIALEDNDIEKWCNIPKNWSWTCLDNLADSNYLNDGDWVLKKDMVPDGPVKLIQLGSVGKCFFKDKDHKRLTLEHFAELNGTQIYPGYLLINRLVTNGLNACIIPDIEGVLMTAVDVCWVRPNETKYNIKYLMYTLSSTGIQAIVNQLGHGVTRFRISKLNLIKIPIPYPPLEVQNMIVDKIDELFALCDTIDELQAAYSSDLEVLKSKIIDAGIQGKLTEQLPEDGNAEDLYAAIQEEKTRLIREKKIKKPKMLLEITEDEIPFEIPANWKWVRVGDVINEVIVPQRDKPSFSGDIPWCRIEDRDGIYLNGSKSNQYVSQETIANMNLRVCPVGTVLAACSGASIGTVIINTVECCTNQTFNGLVCSKGLYNWYLFVYLKSKIEVMKRMGSGSAMAYISQDKFRNMIIPLPPYNEQIRIIEFIDKLIHFR